MGAYQDQTNKKNETEVDEEDDVPEEKNNKDESNIALFVGKSNIKN
jgi:hypothetical protein